MASAIPLGKYLKVAPDMLPGDQHMPRVSGPNFGQSERLTVSPGHEEQGIFNMPVARAAIRCRLTSSMAAPTGLPAGRRRCCRDLRSIR
jgi:hypothetical protein